MLVNFPLQLTQLRSECIQRFNVWTAFVGEQANLNADVVALIEQGL